jgi:integrase/recombinase XerD
VHLGSRFANYIPEMAGADQVNQWTRSISQSFVKHLLKTRSERTGRKLAPNTINRVLATVRNSARWVHRQRPFLAGSPMERISDEHTPDPEWRGVSDVAVTRLCEVSLQATLTALTSQSHVTMRFHIFFRTKRSRIPFGNYTVA